MPSATARKNWARRFRSRARCSPSARTTARQDAGAHVAGLALGQDLSERLVRWRGPTPQFSLGKSFPGFSPIGPTLVTPDEFADPDDIGIGWTRDLKVVLRPGDRLVTHADVIGEMTTTFTAA